MSANESIIPGFKAELYESSDGGLVMEMNPDVPWKLLLAFGLIAMWIVEWRL